MKESKEMEYSILVFEKFKKKEYGMKSFFTEEDITDLELELILLKAHYKFKNSLSTNIE